MRHSKAKGFTLIELLVVIAIILTLSATLFVIGKDMIRKSRATVMATNMKQMSSYFTAYATDNQELLMPCRGDLLQPDGSFDTDALWIEIILSMQYENSDPARFKQEDWWKSNDSFLDNPMFLEGESPRGWEPLNPGYGYNLMLPENYEIAESGVAASDDALERTQVPMAYIDEPNRTPIVAPCDNYFYRYDETQITEFENGTIRNFMVKGTFPVLFLDGHVESLSPSGYIDRRLHEMPLDEN